MGPGLVKGGSRGIALFGGGFHNVKGVTIGPVDEDGIRIQSNDNTIINNIITVESSANGVITKGGVDRNIIKGNTVVNTGNGFGIQLSVDAGDTDTSNDDNQILDNTLIGGSDGINVTGKRNIIQGNTINQSGSSGIAVRSFRFGPDSEGVIIKDNSITNSNVLGIGVDEGSTNTVIIGNTLAGNTDDIEVSVFADS